MYRGPIGRGRHRPGRQVVPPCGGDHRGHASAAVTSPWTTGGRRTMQVTLLATRVVHGGLSGTPRAGPGFMDVFVAAIVASELAVVLVLGVENGGHAGFEPVEQGGDVCGGFLALFGQAVLDAGWDLRVRLA